MRHGRGSTLSFIALPNQEVIYAYPAKYSTCQILSVTKGIDISSELMVRMYIVSFVTICCLKWKGETKIVDILRS